MNNARKIVVHFTVMFLAVGAAEARGPSAQPWLIYPVRAMDTCRENTAPPHIEARCGDLLSAYSRELEACVPMRRGGPVVGAHQVSLQQSNPECAAMAAKIAAETVK
jgi:hypothetical protein